jgi:ribose transport system ATP-binding protein
MEELTEGSHRVFVMRDRRTVTELAREEISQDAIMGAMAHGESENNVEEVQS